MTTPCRLWRVDTITKTNSCLASWSEPNMKWIIVMLIIWFVWAKSCSLQYVTHKQSFTLVKHGQKSVYTKCVPVKTSNLNYPYRIWLTRLNLYSNTSHFKHSNGKSSNFKHSHLGAHWLSASAILGMGTGRGGREGRNWRRAISLQAVVSHGRQSYSQLQVFWGKKSPKVFNALGQLATILNFSKS